jgi:DNA-binding transcriptional ArsR family regulator
MTQAGARWSARSGTTLPKRHRSRVRTKAPSAAPLFAALSDENRLRLVSLLCVGGPMSITKLAAGSNVTRQGITKHLHVMEKAGLVKSARHGRERLWQVDQHRVHEAQRYLEQISSRWDRALERLKALVE